MPPARNSRIRETQMRCPLIHGVPKQTFGSIDMRASKSSCFLSVSLPETCRFGLWCAGTFRLAAPVLDLVTLLPPRARPSNSRSPILQHLFDARAAAQAAGDRGDRHLASADARRREVRRLRYACVAPPCR